MLLVSGAALLSTTTVAGAATEAEVVDWVRVFTFQDYNTRVVALGTTLLGVASGVIGSFTLLRKRALVGDAISHATLPGIALAFIVATVLGYSGKTLPILLGGATISGVCGLALVLLMRRVTRIKEDAALGIVLSVLFGLGVVLLSAAQRMSDGNSAGLESFIYGKTASMIASDAWLILVSAAFVLVGCLLLFKELRLLCFDEGYAASQGWAVLLLDIAMMAMVVVVTVVGLQAVGLVLIIAFLIIPAAGARFWTERLSRMVLFSALAGGLSGLAGALTSAVVPDVPSGATIVIVSAIIFFFSMLFGSSRGVVVRMRRRLAMGRRVRRQHLLRAMIESCEALQRPDDQWLPRLDLLDLRSWTLTQLKRELRRAEWDKLVERSADGSAVRLTPEGVALARRVVRNHRLWEVFLIRHADIAASHVDRDADAIEHVLGADMVRTLEANLVPAGAGELTSPHLLTEPAHRGRPA
jgi:manganese/zinc/iron transport system permease protein